MFDGSKNNRKIYCCSVFASTFKRLIYHICVKYKQKGDALYERKMCFMFHAIFTWCEKIGFDSWKILLFDTWHFSCMFLNSEKCSSHLELIVLMFCYYCKKLCFFLFFKGLVLLWIPIFNSFMISWTAIIYCWRVISFIICFIRIDSSINDAWGLRLIRYLGTFDGFHVETYTLCLRYLHYSLWNRLWTDTQWYGIFFALKKFIHKNRSLV